MTGPWRVPAEESVDLYPGLVVHDGRVSGSITINQSRLPMWAFVGYLPHGGWDSVVQGWPYIETEYGWDAYAQAAFLTDLLQARGEFGRLLLVLADAERCERTRGHGKPWWRTRKHRVRVRRQLERCIEALA